jgi:hypothetical protein
MELKIGSKVLIKHPFLGHVLCEVLGTGKSLATNKEMAHVYFPNNLNSTLWSYIECPMESVVQAKDLTEIEKLIFDLKEEV